MVYPTPHALPAHPTFWFPFPCPLLYATPHGLFTHFLPCPEPFTVAFLAFAPHLFAFTDLLPTHTVTGLHYICSWLLRCPCTLLPSRVRLCSYHIYTFAFVTLDLYLLPPYIYTTCTLWVCLLPLVAFHCLHLGPHAHRTSHTFCTYRFLHSSLYANPTFTVTLVYTLLNGSFGSLVIAHPDAAPRFPRCTHYPAHPTLLYIAIYIAFTFTFGHPPPDTLHSHLDLPWTGSFLQDYTHTPYICYLWLPCTFLAVPPLLLRPFATTRAPLHTARLPITGHAYTPRCPHCGLLPYTHTPHTDACHTTFYPSWLFIHVAPLVAGSYHTPGTCRLPLHVLLHTLQPSFFDIGSFVTFALFGPLHVGSPYLICMPWTFCTLHLPYIHLCLCYFLYILYIHFHIHTHTTYITHTFPCCRNPHWSFFFFYRFMVLPCSCTSLPHPCTHFPAFTLLPCPATPHYLAHSLYLYICHTHTHLPTQVGPGFLVPCPIYLWLLPSLYWLLSLYPWFVHYCCCPFIAFSFWLDICTHSLAPLCPHEPCPSLTLILQLPLPLPFAPVY